MNSAARTKNCTGNAKFWHGLRHGLAIFLVLFALVAAWPAFAGDEGGDGQTTEGPDPTALDDDAHVQELQDDLNQYWLPAFMDMAEQLSTVMMQQMLDVGAFLDAKQELETQQLFGQLAAEAHRDYQPDMLMCTIGTGVRSLAMAEALSRTNARALDLTMAKRDMMSSDTSAAASNGTDMLDRWEKFKTVYCDVHDADNFLTHVCAANIPAARINKDIDYTRTVEDAYTLNIDFTTPTNAPQPDQEDIIALSRNLFDFKTFEHVSQEFLPEEFAKTTFQDMRSNEAMRSVARNSFSHIVGMRVATPDTDTNNVGPFMRQVMAQMGVVDAEIDQFLGKNPSYFAQMEVLTHKIYESPNFFTNLEATPANVERIGVSLQAIKLMQDRDRYESSLRREMLISSMLELGIRERQRSVTNDVDLTYSNIVGKNPAGP